MVNELVAIVVGSIVIVAVTYVLLHNARSVSSEAASATAAYGRVATAFQGK